jgi:CheY-like chemotaxis protein
MWFMGMAWTLLANALEHSKNSVEFCMRVTPSQMLRVEVHDDGKGVLPGAIPRLFEFDAWLREEDGPTTGVRLACLRAQSTTLGGQCGYAVSKLYGGAMFWFEIPYRPDDSAVPQLPGRSDAAGGHAPTARTAPMVGKAAASTAASPAAAASSAVALAHKPKEERARETAACTRVGGGCILIVDDNLRICQTIANALQGVGYAIEFAHNGRDGLTKMQERHFDLVLSDIQMPRMDGYQMTERLRGLETEGAWAGRPRQLLVMMSANTLKTDIRGALESGADAFCAKPLSLRKLRGALKESGVAAGTLLSRLAEYR